MGAFALSLLPRLARSVNKITLNFHVKILQETSFHLQVATQTVHSPSWALPEPFGTNTHCRCSKGGPGDHVSICRRVLGVNTDVVVPSQELGSPRAPKSSRV